eukprot:CAMPEP_0202846924 /NCGR_PEP_ID=MMETSP1389-20130828/74107_1 /ASSEMBLY_ACC=CAM_ASM_000865 /TAXON_ID=302021 /ORGANISM="Rhodomonas sp., Strain CCMP768" /LENGTH=43 /DNA_ID= /DNA_START= /DNA_END= /DNA_ORIENTATION=
MFASIAATPSPSWASAVRLVAMPELPEVSSSPCHDIPTLDDDG